MAVVGDLVAPATAAATRACSAACSASRSSPVHCSAASSSTTSWRWIFYVNLPLGLVALAVIATAFRSRQVTTRRIDCSGRSSSRPGSPASSSTRASAARAAPGTRRECSRRSAVSRAGALPAHRGAREADPAAELFRNMTFRTTSAIGFVVGFALFGRHLHPYLQIVKGHSATESGLLMTPMMLGVLVLDGSGFLISRGRYRALSDRRHGHRGRRAVPARRSRLRPRRARGRLHAAARSRPRARDAGARARRANAVDYRLLGVATSGATLFRQRRRSIGVSAFGAIFTNELGRELTRRLPAGAHAPAHANPAPSSTCRPRSMRCTSRPSPSRFIRSS